MNKMWVCNIGGMILAGETEVIEEKPVPVLLCPPEILHVLTSAKDWNSTFHDEKQIT